MKLEMNLIFSVMAKQSIWEMVQIWKELVIN